MTEVQMANVAFVFPGQGSQRVGMGRDLYATSSIAKQTFDEADACLGFPLSSLCFEGPADELGLTANTQPALLTVSVALLRELKVTPSCAAGHSLGEYAAHVASGSLDFRKALRVVRLRGEAMQRAVPVGRGGMAAVMGISAEAVEEVCSRVDGVASANYNAPTQTVIAGSTEGVRAAMEACKEAGAKVIRLPVSAPFHSEMMRPAENELAPVLEELSLNEPDFPVYSNVSALPVSTAEQVRESLTKQISRAVRWEQSVRKMVQDGVCCFVEIGPGKTLTNLLGRIDKSARGLACQGVQDIEGTRRELDRGSDTLK